MNEEKKESLYISVRGGLGYNLSLASVAVELKQKYKKICVCSPYVDVFETCNFIDHVYHDKEFRDFIFDAKYDNAKLLCMRLYDMEGFIFKKLSYADAWRKLCDIPVKNNKNGADTISTLNPLQKFPQDQKFLDDVMNKIKNDNYENFVIMQFEGGQSPLNPVPTGMDGKPDWSQVQTDYFKEPLKRHYPFEMAAEFIKMFQKEHPKTAIIMYQLPNEHTYEKTFNFEIPYLCYYDLAKKIECVGTVSIDSSLQHLVAGVTKSVVIWGHSLPDSFGYSYNKNIIQHCNREQIFYFTDLGPSNAKIDYIKPEELLKEVDDYLFSKKE